jgi:hypothetical protein
MQGQFAGVMSHRDGNAVYIPTAGLHRGRLGYEKGNAVSNLVNPIGRADA